jgi:predicted nucleotidyltransferase
METGRQEVERAIERAVAGEADVLAAYLFGSLARGTAGMLSDIDIGLLLAAGVDGDPVCDRVMERLASDLRTDRIDVVPLRQAPLPLRYRVVSEGVVVLSRSPAALERFFVESVLQYLDFKVLRDRAFKTQSAAIRQGT